MIRINFINQFLFMQWNAYNNQGDTQCPIIILILIQKKLSAYAYRIMTNILTPVPVKLEPPPTEVAIAQQLEATITLEAITPEKIN